MRPLFRQTYMCLIPVFCIVGIPMLIHGGVNIPSSLTNEEAYAAGSNQIQVLEQKRLSSPEYKEMLIGVGFFATAISMLGLCVVTMWCCPTYVIAPEESDPGPPSTIP